MSYYFLFSSIFRKDSDFCNCLQKDHLFLSYTFAHLNFQDTFSWAWQSHWGFSLLWSSDFKSWLKIWILLSPGCLIIHTHKLFLQISQPPCSQAVLLQTLIFHMQDEKDSTSFDPLHMPGVKETFLSDHPGASLAATVLQSETSTAGTEALPQQEVTSVTSSSVKLPAPGRYLGIPTWPWVKMKPTGHCVFSASPTGSRLQPALGQEWGPQYWEDQKKKTHRMPSGATEWWY